MFPFSGLNGRIYGRNQFQNIKDNHREDVGKILIGYFFVCKQNGNRPPKTKTVDAQQSKLRKQRLQAMPTDKISRFSVGNIEKESGYQINNRQRQSSNNGHQRHEITVGRFFGFVFRWFIGKGGFVYHSCL